MSKLILGILFLLNNAVRESNPVKSHQDLTLPNIEL